MGNLANYLRRFSFLSPDLESEVDEIVDPDPRRRHEFYWKPGRICPYIWYLESGLIRIYEINEEKEATTYIQEADGVFIAPDSSLGGRVASKVFIEALEDCMARRASIQDVNNLMTLYPDFRSHYILINETYRREEEQRKVDLLTLSARDRVKKLAGEHPDWFHRISHPILWDYLGMTKNTFNDHRRDLGL